MNFIAFDLETTGTVAGIDSIVEIGAVKFVGGKVDEIYSTLVDPCRSIPEEATKVNKITNEMVSGMPLVETLLAPFAQFCGDLPLVAHNSAFDYQFLLSDYKKYEISGPKGKVYDTYALGKVAFPGLLNYKLSTVAQHLNIPLGTLHRAHEDATYCGRVFLKILKQLNQSSDLSWDYIAGLTPRKPYEFPEIIKQPKQFALF